MTTKKKKAYRRRHSVDPAAELFKIFIPEFASQRLLIPPAYVNKFKRTFSERVILKDVNGKRWQVNVEKTLKGTFFGDGWQKFVGDHDIKIGEFLVFTYAGCFTFMVNIFGVDGCKRMDFDAAQEDVDKVIKVE